MVNTRTILIGAAALVVGATLAGVPAWAIAAQSKSTPSPSASSVSGRMMSDGALRSQLKSVAKEMMTDPQLRKEMGSMMSDPQLRKQMRSMMSDSMSGSMSGKPSMTDMSGKSSPMTGSGGMSDMGKAG